MLTFLNALSCCYLIDYTLVKSSWIGVTKLAHKEGIIVDLCQSLALFLNFFSNCGSVLFSGGRQSVRRTTVCVFDDNGQAGCRRRGRRPKRQQKIKSLHSL